MPIPVRGNHGHDARGLDHLIVGSTLSMGERTTMSDKDVRGFGSLLGLTAIICIAGKRIAGVHRKQSVSVRLAAAGYVVVKLTIPLGLACRKE